MGFERKVPSTAGELYETLEKLVKERRHVVSVKVNMSNSHLEVDLDGKANFFGYPDVYMPIRRGRLAEAEDLVKMLLGHISRGDMPSRGEVEQLYSMIDHEAK